MTDVVARVRDLISDPLQANKDGTLISVFSNLQLQTACDERREDVVGFPLAQKPFVTPVTQITVYDEYYSIWKGGWWESDIVMQDADALVVVPDTADYHIGRWTFITQPFFPLTLTGSWYDTYAIAADVLEMWAAKEKLNFDIQLDYQQFRRNQKFLALLELAEKYRQKQKPIIAQLVRSDVRPMVSGPGISPVFGDNLTDYRGW